jgi:hypothetical protein
LVNSSIFRDRFSLYRLTPSKSHDPQPARSSPAPIVVAHNNTADPAANAALIARSAAADF